MVKAISKAVLATFLLGNSAISVAQDAAPTDAQAFLEVLSRESLKTVTDPASNHASVADHLTRLISFARSGQLTPATTTRIRDAARQRLTSEQHYAVVMRAIDLASIVGDQQTLEQIASDPAQVRTLGFSESGMIDRIQQAARDGLAGVPQR